jgi:fructose-specific phosphotransferase system IIC component
MTGADGKMSSSRPLDAADDTPRNLEIETVKLSPLWKLLFLAALTFTIVSLVVTVLLAVIVKHPSDQVTNVIDTFGKLVLLGVGLILGLIAGKSV